MTFTLDIPTDRTGRPLPPVTVAGRTWRPVVLTDSHACRRCGEPVRVGEVAYERPADTAGYLCPACASRG